MSGESLNDCVVRNCGRGGDDLADRRVFVVDDAAWAQLQALLDAPPVYRPEVARLLANPPIGAGTGWQRAVTWTGPVHLDQSHTVGGFDCGDEVLNRWLTTRALSNQHGGSSRTWVGTDEVGHVVAF